MNDLRMTKHRELGESMNQVLTSQGDRSFSPISNNTKSIDIVSRTQKSYIIRSSYMAQLDEQKRAVDEN